MALIATAEYQTPARRAEKLRNPDLLAARGAWLVLREAGVDAACLFAVADGRHCGIFDLATRPEYRRRGLGERLIRAAAHWAPAWRRHGLGPGGPQPMPPAALQERLGLREAYRYRYLSPYRLDRALRRGSAAAFSTSRSSTARTRRGRRGRPPRRRGHRAVRPASRAAPDQGARRDLPVTDQGASSAMPIPARRPDCVVSTLRRRCGHGFRPGAAAIRPSRVSWSFGRVTVSRQNSWPARSSGVAGTRPVQIGGAANSAKSTRPSCRAISDCWRIGPKRMPRSIPSSTRSTVLVAAAPRPKGRDGSPGRAPARASPRHCRRRRRRRCGRCRSARPAGRGHWPRPPPGIEDADRLQVEGRAGFGRRKAARRAQQQRHAEPVLQLADDAGDAGLAHRQVARGAGDVAGLHHAAEDRELLQPVHMRGCYRKFRPECSGRRTQENVSYGMKTVLPVVFRLSSARCPRRRPSRGRSG